MLEFLAYAGTWRFVNTDSIDDRVEFRKARLEKCAKLLRQSSIPSRLTSLQAQEQHVVATEARMERQTLEKQLQQLPRKITALKKKEEDARAGVEKCAKMLRQLSIPSRLTSLEAQEQHVVATEARMTRQALEKQLQQLPGKISALKKKEEAARAGVKFALGDPLNAKERSAWMTSQVAKKEGSGRVLTYLYRRELSGNNRQFWSRSSCISTDSESEPNNQHALLPTVPFSKPAGQ